MTRWNLLPWYDSGFPDFPTPFSPVHSAPKRPTQEKKGQGARNPVHVAPSL